MESRAKLFGHSIHQMLIVFPLGLLATAVIFDIVYLRTGRPGWSDASYHMIPAGIIGGLIAAVFGPCARLFVPRRRSRTRYRLAGRRIDRPARCGRGRRRASRRAELTLWPFRP